MITLTWHHIKMEEKSVIKGILSNSYISLIYYLVCELPSCRGGANSLFLRSIRGSTLSTVEYVAVRINCAHAQTFKQFLFPLILEILVNMC